MPRRFAAAVICRSPLSCALLAALPRRLIAACASVVLVPPLCRCPSMKAAIASTIMPSLLHAACE